MKPILLGRPSLPFPPVLDVVRKAHRNDLGEIDVDCIKEGEWSSKPFYDHLRLTGYRKRDCRRYLEYGLTFVDGSCRWHDDPGFGLVACWLVYDENTLGNEPQLITRHGPMDMRVGDLIVFDANQGHAWLSNGVSVMVMATVARVRKGKGSAPVHHLL